MVVVPGSTVVGSSSEVTPDVPVKISVRGVGKRYAARGGVEALADVDLDIAAGEFVCLVGPSGCGKSTLLKMMANLVRPSAGELLIYSDSLQPTAMVFQDYGIFPWKTVRANVRFGVDILKVPHRVGAERTGRLLERLGLADFADAYPTTLSGGMQQRVAIARALAVEPDILLMDEPFAALDAQLRRLLQEQLLEIWQEEEARTVVFVTHSLDEALLLGDRVVVMSARPGRILEDIRVPFPRPRDSSIRTDSTFRDLEQHLWDLLRAEAYAASTEPNRRN